MVVIKVIKCSNLVLLIKCMSYVIMKWDIKNISIEYCNIWLLVIFVVLSVFMV